jgi:uncharacterized protein (DUF1330 family)
MPAYVVGNVSVQDAEAYREYMEAVPATIAAHGGRFVARAGATEMLEGAWHPRVVILEFPSMDAARAWYRSDDYQRIAAIRHRNADSRLVLVDGLER